MDNTESDQGAARDSWDRLKAAIRNRLRETGALAMIVGGSMTGPAASAAPSVPEDAGAAPGTSIIERVKRLRETLGAAPVRDETGDGGPGLAAWDDHWKDHWSNVHWSNHWNNHQWSDHWKNRH